MTHRLVLVCTLTACGSTPAPVGPTEPAKFGDFYAKLEKLTTGKTEVPPLGGTVTCWGGPGTLNQTTTEIYMRRSVDYAGGALTEDLVTLSEGDQSRFIWRAPIVEGAGTLGNLEELNGHYKGTALFSDTVSNQFYELDKWNSLYVNFEKITPTHMTIVSLGDERTKLAKLGVKIPHNGDEMVAVLTAADAHTAEFGVQVHGELDVIEPARCAEMFGHFSAARRVWPAPDGAPPVKTKFETPIERGTIVND